MKLTIIENIVINFTGTDAKQDTVEAVLVIMQLVLARKSVKYIMIHINTTDFLWRVLIPWLNL